jgi:hypothetical protein
MVETTCSRCGKPMRVGAYRLKRNLSGLLFCSKECRRADGSTLGRPRIVPDMTCPVCGVLFHRKAVERRPVNYCSYACAAKGTGNLRPAQRGERRSPTTEFRAGQRSHNRVPVGTVRVRQRPGRGGDQRAWLKVAEPNVWRPRAVVMWELANGPVPRGTVIHHENRDTLDDRIENLRAVSRATHLHEHRPEFEAKRASRAAGRRAG